MLSEAEIGESTVRWLTVSIFGFRVRGQTRPPVIRRTARRSCARSPKRDQTRWATLNFPANQGNGARSLFTVSDPELRYRSPWNPSNDGWHSSPRVENQRSASVGASFQSFCAWVGFVQPAALVDPLRSQTTNSGRGARSTAARYLSATRKLGDPVTVQNTGFASTSGMPSSPSSFFLRSTTRFSNSKKPPLLRAQEIADGPLDVRLAEHQSTFADRADCLHVAALGI